MDNKTKWTKQKDCNKSQEAHPTTGTRAAALMVEWHQQQKLGDRQQSCQDHQLRLHQVHLQRYLQQTS